ncbi:hypothetical protein SPICUR_03680 [Spiribacter curvatus]|uniref:GST N-terminal domain-containing protein n=1 Tax=Spiribacter curvatus TaxID=1335757 RepID=U5T6D4_9GAMM|nr:hypothetical protein SPICUR_03680 [Spiribacter curvatus]
MLTPFMIVGYHLSKPRGVQRTAEEQSAVDEHTRSLALYHFPACPFCIKTRRVMDRLSLNIELRNALQPGEHRETLEREGGRIKVPCLRIAGEDGTVRWLYESDEIIAHLEHRFGTENGDGDKQ